MLLIRTILIKTAKLYFKLIFLSNTKAVNKNRLFLFDIDNTLADSWHSLLISGWKNQNRRLASLAVFLRMRRLVLLLQKSPFNQIVFITARSNYSWMTTHRWLDSIGISVSRFSVIVTRTPDEKVELLRLIRKINTYFIDDLSIQHETGNPQIRTDLIKLIQQLPLRYYGKTEIDEFNQL